jgi:hypothetical protein
MSWDDFAPFLVGTGPDVTVQDPDLNPNNILDETLGGSVKVDWSFSGVLSFLVPLTTFTVSLYAESMGPGPEIIVGSVPVPGTGPLTATIPITPGTLPGPGPGVSGVYKLTVVITNTVTGSTTITPLAGFVEGPMIQMRHH